MAKEFAAHTPRRAPAEAVDAEEVRRLQERLAALDAAAPSSVRLDTWLHSVRLFKTRSLGATAIKAAHVRVNGESVKPSYALSIGEQVTIRQPGYSKEYIVRRLLNKRVAAPIARLAYEDISPPPPPQLFAVPARREKGSGRPTKKERRELDRLRGREAQNGRYLPNEPMKFEWDELAQ